MDLVTWLKVIGAIASGIGAILLAWRASKILKWVVLCLVAHEQSITQLKNLASNQDQTDPIVLGMTKHLLNIESKLGIFLLILGLTLLGIGMLCNAVTYIIASP